ncbi:hypothetical protein BGX34_000683 [Mortierella sp. NVP85]|nr:hypothetical protein BGX34_000683 [Mortierella sp. NVP85]
MNQVVTSDVVHWICAEHFTNRQHEIAEDHQDEDTDEEDHKGNFDEEQWLLDEQTEAVDHHGLHYNVWTEREKLVLSLHGKVEQEATALQELIKAVSDRHASVREAAIRVLRGPSKGGSRPALQAVIEAVKDSQWNVQEAALQVLGDQKQLSFKLVTVLIASAAGSWHLHVMRAAKDALIKHVSSGSIHQCLVDILLSGATVEKVVAIEVLATDVKLPESAIEALIMELESDTQDIRSAAVYALQRQSKLSELTIQKLSSIAKNGPLNVRKAAIRVLGSQISVSATLTLSECLKDESEDVLIATVQALRPNSQLPQSTVRQLMKALSHEHVEVREAVAEALGGQISLSEATKQTLVNLLNNDTPSVKEAFVQAIGNRMQQSVIDALVGIPEDRGPGASRTTGYSSEIKRELHEPPIQGPKSRTWEKQQSPATETQDRLRHDMIREIDFKDVTNIQPLKRGGFGEIRTAEWSRLRVILKMGFSNHTDGKMQFDQELEVLKRVQGYDYIIPLYGVTTDPHTNVRWMVMKYCPNGNLAMFLEKHYEDLTWLERYRICSEVTKGLEFLHKSGFHHRDLHSGNILLDDKRTAMLCDFGLSRSSSRDQTTEVGATVGVASFLAPERFPAQRPAYTAACDIYSLGVTFWHISSGRIPFVSRLRDPKLLRELMDGLREEFIPGTPREFRDLIVKCWDKEPSKRLEIDVVIAILQTLMAKSSGPLHQMRSEKASRALPVPPDLDSKMANLERASNMLNRMVFDIRDPVMKETVDYIERTRAYFRDRSLSQKPYTPSNPPKTPIYMCPLVGDIAALRYYLSQGGYYREPINESSEQTGDTSLHLACLFLESPMDTIKVLVELGADINLENLQGYTPLMILVSSNTQHCYEAVMYLRMRGARIPSYIRNPITPLNNAQLYALNALNEFAQTTPSGWDIKSPTNGTSRTWPEIWLSVQDTVQKKSEKEVYQLSRYDQPLIHVIAAMQDDYRILDCVWEAGLDPTVSVAGITTLVAAAAHLRIGNIEWLLNNHVEVSTETNVQKAIDVVKMIHVNPLPAVDPQRGSSGSPFLTDVSTMDDTVWHELLSGIRDIRKYSWAGVASGEADGLRESMVDLVLDLLEQWIGDRGLANRWDVVTKFNVTYGSLLPLAGKSDVKGVNVDRLERVHLQLKRAVGKILGNPTASSTPSEAPPSYYP